MRYIFKIGLLSVPLLALTACNNMHDSNWTENCKKYHSYDTREQKQCETRHARPANGVEIDPQGTEIPQEEARGKRWDK